MYIHYPYCTKNIIQHILRNQYKRIEKLIHVYSYKEKWFDVFRKKNNGTKR